MNLKKVYELLALSPVSAMNITYPRAGAENLAELVAMMKELQQDDPWSCPFDDEITARVVEQLLRSPDLGHIWFIAVDGQNVGYIVMSYDYSLEYRGRNAWVDEFFIRPSHRGLGIGSKALDFFAQQAKELGVTVVH
ncbi:MAG TPA: GNAT family N-acetyltransferase, partial [Candidatus Sulfotelmatobacter sp.]|nr:GNAT family N-acetyltransferase [Candidatus Sulfotelmatobacter sp.]